MTLERLDEALIRHGFYELLPEGVENLDAGLPLVIHHLDRVGHDGIRHGLLGGDHQQTPDCHTPMHGLLVGQEVVGIERLALFPEIPVLHQGIHGALDGFHQTDRFGLRRSVLIEQALRFHLAELLADGLDLPREIARMGWDVQHDVHGRPSQFPVFLGFGRSPVLLRHQHQLDRILPQQLGHLDAQFLPGDFQAATQVIGFGLRDAELVGQRIVAFEVQAVLQLLDVPGNLLHGLSSAPPQRSVPV